MCDQTSVWTLLNWDSQNGSGQGWSHYVIKRVNPLQACQKGALPPAPHWGAWYTLSPSPVNGSSHPPI